MDFIQTVKRALGARDNPSCDEKDEAMRQEKKLNDSVRAVDRALEILLAFTATDHELSVADLLRRVELSRPTLYRLLGTLEQSGFVVAAGEPQKFRLGPSVAHLMHVWSASLNISSIAQPMLRKVWEQTGETVALFVPQGEHRICLVELPSAQPLSFKRGVGYRERIVIGASGRVILAYMETHTEALTKTESGTDIDRKAFVHELALIRRRGYAVSRNALIQGAVAVAAPFFAADGRVAGSVALFGPSARIDAACVKTYAALLIEQATALSRSLGLKTPK